MIKKELELFLGTVLVEVLANTHKDDKHKVLKNFTKTKSELENYIKDIREDFISSLTY